MNHSFTRLMTAVAAIAFIGIGCAKTQTSSTPSAKPLPIPPEVERADFVTYYVNNISFEYPSGWEVGEQEANGITSYIMSDPYENVRSSASGLSAVVTFSPQQKTPGTETKTMREAFIEELAQAKQNPGATVSDLKEFILHDGRPGWWFSSTENFGQEFDVMTIMFLVDADNTTLYRWRVWGSEESIQANLGKIYRTINSTKIK